MIRLRPSLLVAVFMLPSVVRADAVLTGPGGLSVTLTPEVLAGMPAQEVETTHHGSKGEQTGHYRGVLLWDVIASQTDLDDDVKSALRLTILVTARDDHQVAFSIGEIAPDFGSRPVMIGYQLDDAPIPDGLRMVSPGDVRGARYVKDVVRLEIR